MSENYAQTPTQQLLAKLRECETTMTKGPWHKCTSPDYFSTPEAETFVVRDCDDLVVCPLTRVRRTDGSANAHGIATLKNSNPTVIAMLERAIGALAYYARFSSDAATASAALAHLDALAREALKEKTDGKA